MLACMFIFHSSAKASGQFNVKIQEENDQWIEIGITGEDLESVYISESLINHPYLTFTFEEETSDTFKELSTKHLGKTMGMFIGEEEILSATIADSFPSVFIANIASGPDNLREDRLRAIDIVRQIIEVHPHVETGISPARAYFYEKYIRYNPLLRLLR